jgi:small GTP-binding protein
LKKRALVSSIAKTTRDTLTENVQIHGYRFQIMDTAGLHNPDNYLDQESVKQSLANIERAEIIFWLHDNATEFSKEELTFLDLIKNKCQDKPIWLILTKADIPLQINHQVSNAIFQNSHLISTISGAGLELLLLDLTKFLFPQRQEPLPLAAVSEQMSLEIVDFLQKVDLLTAKHKMVKVFMAQILNCISKIGNTENGYK